MSNAARLPLYNNKPFTDYWIAGSHNTYVRKLTQRPSKNAVDMYIAHLN